MVILSYLLGLHHGNYSEETRLQLVEMPKPIVLKDKEKMTFWYSVIVQDGKGDLHRFGSISAQARAIGEKYQINDTISIK